jgi:hypothetical protein
MLYPDDFEHLAALSERVSRWVLGWASRHWRRLPISARSKCNRVGSTTAPIERAWHLSTTHPGSVRY